MDLAIVSIILTATGVGVGALSFVVARIKDAERRGAFEQRVKTLEAQARDERDDRETLTRLTERVAVQERSVADLYAKGATHDAALTSHDAAVRENARENEYLRESLSAINTKLDTVLAKMSECRLAEARA